MTAGEVWEINFSPQVGDEIRKTRPAIVVNNDTMGSLDLKVVVPVTDGSKMPREWHVVLSPSPSNGLSKLSIADCFQVKSVSQKRFIRRLGKLSSDEMDDVKLGLMKVLDLL